jgi:uncharacterized ferritin-like protein (DUF455 family)
MPSAKPATLTAAVVAALSTANPHDKATATRQLVAAWQAGCLSDLGSTAPPARPARPTKPALLPPRAVPRRRITAGAPGRIALLHAIAHIELNAIDLALDMACRFVAHRLPTDFYHDWLGVADDEARHFLMLSDRLHEFDVAYGDVPAHDGLWQAADSTKHDVLARLAIAPLVLEARGLDVTPAMIDKLTAVGDRDSAAALGIIMHDEVGHVGVGKRWFDYVCGIQRLDPVSSWHKLVTEYFHGDLKPPFNIAARRAAKFSAAFYGPLAERDDLVSPRR